LMKWTEKAEFITRNLSDELGMIIGEPLAAISKGENFRVKLHSVNLSELDTDKCICGTSCTEYSAWSKCAGVNESEGYIEFSAGKWMKNATPCFTDLYMLLVNKSGKNHAGCVKIQVRR
ncbi:MAG: hypothetical protein IJP54_07560, partial [Synergistaceae bacterium]|nr:hypothetical protein [Synergistaceae bacterium]